MAFQAGRSIKILGMAIAACCAFMINSAMFPKAWVRSVITGIPVAGVMAFGAIIPEHSLVISRITMTAGAVRRSIAETPGVAAFAGQVGMTVC